MKILITGGTGFVGKALCRELILNGYSIHLLTRDPEKAKETFDYPARIFSWSGDSIEDLSCFDGVTAIVHLAGESVAEGRWNEEKKKRILKSRVQGTEVLLSGLRRAQEAKRCGQPAFVGASAIGYYGDRGDETLTESSTRGTGFLSDVCDAWEHAAGGAERGPQPMVSRSVLFRIGIVLGRDGGALKKMLPVFRAGLGGVLASGRQWMSWIHMTDLVALLMKAIEDPKWSGVFNATAPTPVTNREFTKALGVAVGRPAVIPVPGFAVRAAFGEVATELLSSHRVLPERAQERAFSFRFGRLENALGDICGTPGEKIYHTEQLIDRPVSEVFSFFCDAKNLEILTPPWLHFNVLGATDDSGARLDTTDIKQGMLIDYKLKIHGVPVKWRTMIERWQPPQAFVDTQLKGPYRLWHHTHEFIELPPQGGTSARTLMIDHVRYQEPLGALGQVAAGWFVDADVAKIFNYRRQKIKELFA